MDAAACAAIARFSAARSSCAAGSTPSTRLPYSALNARQPSRSPMPTVTSTLSRNSCARSGQDTSPRSPPGMSPAAKLSPTRATPAFATADSNASTSESSGTAVSKGHQNSTASKPAALAAAGRSSRGFSVNRREQLTANGSVWFICDQLSVIRKSISGFREPRHTAYSRQGRGPPVTVQQEAGTRAGVAASSVPPVQSVARAFELLEVIADTGGMANLSDLPRDVGLPLGTIHRLLRTLVDLGYLRQQPSREYALGPRLIRLGESSSQLVGPWARPYLASLVDALGETANLAMLDGNQIVYVAQVPSRHSMRMFTEVGKRVSPHCTAVGKAMLSSLPRTQVDAILRAGGMHSYTDSTITDPVSLADQLELVRDNGYATDEGEKETGVRCVAVPVLGAPARMAMSISGPAPRMTDTLVERAVPVLVSTARALAADLTGRGRRQPTARDPRPRRRTARHLPRAAGSHRRRGPVRR